MDDVTYANYPPQLTPEQEKHLTETVQTWATQHGLVVRPASSFVAKETDPRGCLATNAPVTLFPSLLPEKCYEDARAVQKPYNELYAAIATNVQWLAGVIE
ncbi:hypothetical protein KEM55_008990, partial [Ascosphaera atra]